MLVRASVWFVEMPPPLVREKIPLNKVGYKYTEFFWWCFMLAKFLKGFGKQLASKKKLLKLSP